MLKTLETIGNNSKIIVSIQPYFVTSIKWGEVVTVQHCDKRLPLMWHSFRERSNFPRIWFRDPRIGFWGLEIKHLKAHNFVWQRCFFLSLSCNFDDQLSGSNFHRFVIWCIYWDWPSEKIGLWQLPVVSSVFNLTEAGNIMLMSSIIHGLAGKLCSSALGILRLHS